MLWPAAASAQPNLTPYRPFGWSDTLVISTNQYSRIDETDFKQGQIIYCNWAVMNNGTAPTNHLFWTNLLLDGYGNGSWYTDVPLDPYWQISDQGGVMFGAPGWHWFQVVADATNTIAESNESDNTYTKVFYVAQVWFPNLTPYQPAGWSDKIVVSTSLGSRTDSVGLKSTDILYISAAIVNNGEVSTFGFTNAVFVDGNLVTSWSPSQVFNGGSTSIQDFAIGTLSPGTHVIRVVADTGEAVAESNENDNEYSKTITVVDSSPVKKRRGQIISQ